MDPLDRRILREVQRNAGSSAADLAERCGTTESTALRRLKRLRQKQIITREVAVIDPVRVGRGMGVILSIRLERERPAEVEDFRRRIAAHPDVTNFYFVTGTWDYVVILSIRNMGDYDRFLSEMVVGQPAVVGSDTQVVIQPIKVGGPIPIDELDVVPA